MNKRLDITNSKCWVIKIGSSSITANGVGIDTEALHNWTTQIAKLKQQGIKVVLVSSGAVAAGMHCLGFSKRPTELNKVQSAAAVGQMQIIHSWCQSFGRQNCQTAQILLTHSDFDSRERYLNARNTLRSLLDLDVVAIINENDTVTTAAIGFGDNDSLAALVANLIDADLLVMLTDQQGLFDSNPRQNSAAKLVTEALAEDPKLDLMAGDAGSLGKGGMQTKIKAARIAAKSGAHSIIISSTLDDVLLKIAQGENVGTFLKATKTPLIARKQWLAGHLKTHGDFIVDDGAAVAIKLGNKSLLPVGVIKVVGEFYKGEMVRIIDNNGIEIARGLTNYPAIEARKLCQKSSNQISEILGKIGSHEFIHRDNLVVI